MNWPPSAHNILPTQLSGDFLPLTPGCLAAVHPRRTFSTAKVFQFSMPLFREWPRLPSTARIGRAQFHRARSASKEGTWPLPPLPSATARSASTETMPATSPHPASSDPRPESV